MKNAKITIALISALSASAAQAQTTNNFLTEEKLTLGFISSEVDTQLLGNDLNISLTGFSVSAGNQWQNGMYVRTDYSSSEGEALMWDISTDVKLASLSLVIGSQFDLGVNGRLYTEAGYQARAIQAKNFGASNDDKVKNYLLGLGYKHQFGENIIAQIGGKYFNKETSVTSSLLYSFTPNFAISAGVDVQSDEMNYNAKLVIDF